MERKHSKPLDYPWQVCQCP